MICITDNIRDNVIDAVDVSVLSNLEDAQVDGEPDLIADLIDLYLENTWRKLAAMSEPAGRDMLWLQRAAHTLKGSSATLGAARTAWLCEEIELMTRRGSLDACTELISAANREFVRVRECLLIVRSKRICPALAETVATANHYFEVEAGNESSLIAHTEQRLGTNYNRRSNCYV